MEGGSTRKEEKRNTKAKKEGLRKGNQNKTERFHAFLVSNIFISGIKGLTAPP
jgi:hypothetical protein